MRNKSKTNERCKVVKPENDKLKTGNGSVGETLYCVQLYVWVDGKESKDIIDLACPDKMMKSPVQFYESESIPT